MLANVLAGFGWTVFWDRDILAGSVFDDVIQEQLDHTKCVVCLWSVHSVSSQWVRAEAEEGANRNMLVSVLIDDVRLPIAFRRIQAAKLFNWTGSKEDEQLKDVLKAVKFVVEKPPQDPGNGATVAGVEAKPVASSGAPAPSARMRTTPPAHGRPWWKQSRNVVAFLVIVTVGAVAVVYFWLTTVASKSEPTKDAILAGKSVFVVLDQLPSHIGTIKPQGQYQVQFLPKNQSWQASGPVYPEGDQSHEDPSSAICAPEKNGFCIWGVAFRFDESGQLFFVAGGDPATQERLQGRLVGRIRSLKAEIAAGRAFVVQLDGLSDHIGTIKPRGQYQVQFLPKNQSWQASGPVYPEGEQSHEDPSSAICAPEKNGFCIWGVAFRFDESGQLFFVAGGDPATQERWQGRLVGRIMW